VEAKGVMVARQLIQEDTELGHHEPEGHNRYGGSYPRQECPSIGEVIPLGVR
jgi:hypothetical protein